MKYKYFRKGLALPFALFLILFVIIPILFIIFYAFTDSQGFFSFDAVVSFFTSTTKLNVLLVSILVGLFNTVLCLLIGFPLAYLLANPKFNKNYVLVMLFVMPMWINFVLRTGALRDLLSIILGWFNTTNGEHPLFCTMVGMVTNYLPFTILPLYSTMLKLDKSQIEAAQDLGANGIKVFLKVIFPLSITGVVSGFTMVFVPSVSTFIISKMLGGGSILVIGDLIEMQFLGNSYNPYLGSAISLVLMLIILICTGIMNQIDNSAL